MRATYRKELPDRFGKRQNRFYPAIVGPFDTAWINTPCDTRKEALAIAKASVKEIQTR